MEGRLISDRYRIVRLLGKGGMGSVWLAEHTTLKSEVAVKLIDSELGKMAQARARFLREAQLAARIKSAHVAQVYDHGVSADGQPFIAMEYLVGTTLRDRLDERGRLAVTDTARIVSHVCRALARAHEAGLIHRDLKPENIFIAKETDGEIVKVLDFGVAKATDALSDSGIDPTRTGALMGTPFYMSPEQAQGLKNIDSRSDLWAMGVVVFECLTGRRPFSAEALGPLIGQIMTTPVPSPSVVAPDAKLSKDIDAWMARALSRELDKRFASARELSEAFMIAAGTTESFPAADRRAGNASSGTVRVEGTAPPDTSALALGPTMAIPSPVAPAGVAAPRVAAPAAGTYSRLPWIVAVVVLAVIATALAITLATRH
jgi:serine/threonine protein kinase